MSKAGSKWVSVITKADHNLSWGPWPDEKWEQQTKVVRMLVMLVSCSHRKLNSHSNNFKRIKMRCWVSHVGNVLCHCDNMMNSGEPVRQWDFREPWTNIFTEKALGFIWNDYTMCAQLCQQNPPNGFWFNWRVWKLISSRLVCLQK